MSCALLHKRLRFLATLLFGKMALTIIAATLLPTKRTKLPATGVRTFIGNISSRASSVTEDVFEARYPNQSSRVQECVGVVGLESAKMTAR